MILNALANGEWMVGGIWILFLYFDARNPADAQFNDELHIGSPVGSKYLIDWTMNDEWSYLLVAICFSAAIKRKWNEMPCISWASQPRLTLTRAQRWIGATPPGNNLSMKLNRLSDLSTLVRSALERPTLNEPAPGIISPSNYFLRIVFPMQCEHKSSYLLSFWMDWRHL